MEQIGKGTFFSALSQQGLDRAPTYSVKLDTICTYLAALPPTEENLVDKHSGTMYITYFFNKMLIAQAAPPHPVPTMKIFMVMNCLL